MAAASEDVTPVRVDSVEDAVEALRGGKFAVVVDDFGRENEGDLILPAAAATAAHLAFVVRHTTGIVCCALSDARCEALALPAMTAVNGDPKGTAFTVSCDLSQRFGVSTGVSAADRARTLRALASPAAKPHHLCRPGHIFPLRYRPGGVLARDGHTEAALDLCLAAGAPPAGLLCEIACDDGTMARLPACAALAAKHGLPLISVADIQRFRAQREAAVRWTGGAAMGPAPRATPARPAHHAGDNTATDAATDAAAAASGAAGQPATAPLAELAALPIRARASLSFEAVHRPDLTADVELYPRTPSDGSGVGSAETALLVLVDVDAAAASGGGSGKGQAEPPVADDGLSPSSAGILPASRGAVSLLASRARATERALALSRERGCGLMVVTLRSGSADSVFAPAHEHPSAYSASLKAPAAIDECPAAAALPRLGTLASAVVAQALWSVALGPEELRAVGREGSLEAPWARPAAAALPSPPQVDLLVAGALPAVWAFGRVGVASCTVISAEPVALRPAEPANAGATADACADPAAAALSADLDGVSDVPAWLA
ncbi:hypothetical protein FNF31_07455 [Cafeteria roenbergensis]|uniref:3,4-dihydroxy-2-butanone-4-phosphate synthase n=1 Tax=Cafeteria roenbergensis TaxID=33653 RepID=A0A5A8C6T8_CAFRO|nr:hypothetical protein FNF31_07455 [Cafeteria roenbergensis]